MGGKQEKGVLTAKGWIKDTSPPFPTTVESINYWILRRGVKPEGRDLLMYRITGHAVIIYLSFVRIIFVL